MKKRLALVIVKIVGAVLVLGYAIFCVRPLIQSFNLWVKDGRNIYFAFTPPTMVVLILGAILCSVILSVIAIKSLFSSKSCDVAKVYIESLRFEMRKNKEIKKQKQIRKLQAKLNKYKESE